MYASQFENVDYIQKDTSVNVVVYENELYEVNIKSNNCCNVDLTNDYCQSKLSEHRDMFVKTLAQAQFAVYYDRTYSYRKYVSPLLYISALTNTIVLFDEQSDYEQCLVNSIYKDSLNLSKYVIINEENCKEKKNIILSDEKLMKKLINVQKEWYNMTKATKLRHI